MDKISFENQPPAGSQGILPDITEKNTVFTQLYHALSGKMYSLCLRYTGNKEAANAVFVNSFAGFFFQCSDPCEPGLCEGQARKHFIIKCIDLLEKRMSFSSQLNEIPASLNNGHSEDPEDLILLIARLPIEQRIIFNMYQIDGYSHREIASMLKITERKSSVILEEAKKSFANLLHA